MQPVPVQRKGQTAQVVPSVPHAEFDVPATHWPLALQQPEHVNGPHAGVTPPSVPPPVGMHETV